MARPPRKNADYFPFYAKDGRTLYILESKYGCKGTGFFTNVMRFLTLETNHHVDILDDTDRMYFFSKCHCDEESGMDMLNIMSKTGKINRELWEIKVIVSQDHMDSIADAYRNRTNDIITMDEIKKKCVSCGESGVSDVGNGVSDVIKPQSKVKKSKVYKKKKFIPPEIKDVIKYFSDNGYTKESAQKAFGYYDVANWKDSTGKQVLNWKQKMRGVWFKDENKIKESDIKKQKSIQAGDMSIYDN